MRFMMSPVRQNAPLRLRIVQGGLGSASYTPAEIGFNQPPCRWSMPHVVGREDAVPPPAQANPAVPDDRGRDITDKRADHRNHEQPGQAAEQGGSGMAVNRATIRRSRRPS